MFQMLNDSVIWMFRPVDTRRVFMGHMNAKVKSIPSDYIAEVRTLQLKSKYFSTPPALTDHQISDYAEKEPVNTVLASLRARLASMPPIEQGELRPDGHRSHNTDGVGLTKHTKLTRPDKQEAQITCNLRT